MKTMYALIAVFVLTVLAGVALVLIPGPAPAPVGTEQTATTTPQGGMVGIADLIRIDAPEKNAVIASPVILTGAARGTWYFEASFPIEIKNASGTVIAQGHGEAQSDWMTENFVPFTATVTYPAQPAGSTGTIVVKNDNPSGDPAREKSVEIPVVFQ